jgi:hypothetical protein
MSSDSVPTKPNYEWMRTGTGHLTIHMAVSFRRIVR